MKLQYLSYQKIDKTRWDNCIASADNSLVYAYSFYLDAMAIQWDAIIIDDYEGVFPLPWKKKWGIKYYYNPPLTPQLGLFKKGRYIIDDDIFSLIHHHVKYGDIFFNYNNEISLKTKPCTNLVLPLNKPYEDIEKNYKKDLRNNLKKAEKEKFIYSTKEEINLAIDLYQQYYLHRTPHTKKLDYERFENLCRLLLTKNMVFTRSVLNEKNEVLSIGIFLFDNKRIYNIMNTTTKEGKDKESNPYLLDRVIQEFSGKNIIFDFEGSEIEGIRYFYEKFNPVSEPYHFYHYNNLSKLLRLIKK